jgi:hypothetical protein
MGYGSSSETELVQEAELHDAEVHEALDHEADDQDALDQEADDQDADDHDALDQEAELQEADDQDALDQDAAFQVRSLRATVAQRAASKAPFVTKRRSERFGFGGFWMLAAAGASSSPTPSARPAFVLAAEAISAPLTWSAVHVGCNASS